MDFSKRGRTPIGLVAFDLDGTLAESKQPLSGDMGLLLAKLLEKMPVAVMSGAGFTQFEKQFLSGMPQHANLEHLYLFPTNAAQCFVYANYGWRTRYDNKFSPEEKQHIIDVLQKAVTQAGLEHEERLWGERIEDRGAQISFSGLGQQAPLEEKKKWDPDHSKKKALRDLLVPQLPDCAITMSGLSTVDITRKGITKAYGIRKLPDMTGVPVDGILYVGDALFEGGNDYVVKQTTAQTAPVKDPKETAKIIQLVLSDAYPPSANIPHKFPMKYVVLALIVLIIILGAGAFYLEESNHPGGSSTSIGTDNASTTSPTSPYADEIVITFPASGQLVSSPVVITGKARGSWYFEANFPAQLQDAQGNIIVQGQAHAQGDWMTDDFVPFTATLTSATPLPGTGFIVLKNDNPSGDPAKQKEVRIPVTFRAAI